MIFAGKLELWRDGTIVKNGLLDDDISKVLNNADVLYFLDREIILASGFTLRDYFRVISLYYPLLHLSSFLKYFVDYVNYLPESGCVDSEIAYIEMKQIVSYMDFSDFTEAEGGDSSPEIENIVHMSGICNTGVNRYAIYSCPLESLLDLEIILSGTEMSIELPGHPKDFDNIEDKYIIRKSENPTATLYDFITVPIRNFSLFRDPSIQNQNEVKNVSS